jgi:hypothetical protein
MSTLLDLADAVRSGLDATTLSSVATQPSVVRLNWPEYEIEELADAVLVVSPGAVTINRVNRTNHEYTYAINVFVARHTPTEETADDMYDLAEEVIDVLRSHVWPAGVTFPTGVTSPSSVEMEVNPDQALQERNVWRAVITASYIVFRAVNT